MPLAAKELNDADLAELNTLLGRVDGGHIPNAEALDGFFAALACCPDLILPSEYLPVIQAGETEAGDLIFANAEEAQRFMGLVSLHWNHVNQQLNEGDVYLPLILRHDHGDSNGNDWAKGFLVGVDLRHDLWTELIEDEEQGGAIIPIMALAYENHPDPSLRPFDGPIDEDKRMELMIAATAGVMHMHAYFLEQRDADLPETVAPFVRSGPKIGRNKPCPCGSGKKYKRCCGAGPTLH